MRHNPFQGTGLALVTPFAADGSLDRAALARLVNHSIDGGVDFLVVLGTTGETATLATDEKKQVLETVAETTNGRIPLVVGVGGNNTAAVCAQLEAGLPSGYTGVLSVSPYYNKPTQEGIYQHYTAVCGSTDAPVILYNVPGRTGSNVLANTVLRVAQDCPNAVAMKEASGNLEQAMAIIQSAPAGFDVLSGDDNLTLPLLACGAKGVISVSGQAYPRLFSGMVRDARAGRLEDAQRAHYELFTFTQLLFAEGNPGGIKAALAHLGLCENFLRLPLVPVSAELNGQLRTLVAQLA
ncbi:MAG: 4-hydroxy-tetrahydrodipicolinate synthase [Schleiferiaceae bacterium]|jgi:4-hydroxy-tetrahydrodipicolinate synthase|nr:4-hydroxy-tetrahydrodipicolinate synthase [Schleiferiaceae bacterium]MDP4627159.1 4-hydroxy-tetrahydrodipicolinate synthase [Schleiferiaceae bacterium]MDP4727605.1 4-hydroxy-tetrahydrodipicolinate synthase [Schleiferiaceae bacterium]MDP4749543.1 4-hydroxy-tetrahydrodipicolinate synthase [Schleiferiaceae bacterium]MDP4858838.1 4-hydroxy-tetrahydrodipicolinate synthase [Schleiferiaceae bacterium]